MITLPRPTRQVVPRPTREVVPRHLVLTPLRIALWDRDRQGQPIAPGALVHHSDSEYESAGCP